MFLAWNVRVLNCLNKQGMCNGCCVLLLLMLPFSKKSKLEVVSNLIAISLWGRHPIEWLYLP